MKKKIMLLVFPAVSLILEVLPYGAVMCHFNPKGRPFRAPFDRDSYLCFADSGNFGSLERQMGEAAEGSGPACPGNLPYALCA